MVICYTYISVPYRSVLATSKEDERGLYGGDLFNIIRNYEKNSTFPIQYFNVNLVLDGENKMSSSSIRNSGKILKCVDVWGNAINNNLCKEIDENISKIIG